MRATSWERENAIIDEKASRTAIRQTAWGKVCKAVRTKSGIVGVYRKEPSIFDKMSTGSCLLHMFHVGAIAMIPQ